MNIYIAVVMAFFAGALPFAAVAWCAYGAMNGWMELAEAQAAVLNSIEKKA